MADDKPTGTWRRVKLADGRFGLVHDADVKVTVTTTPAPAPASPSPPPRLTVTEQEAIVVLPASGRGVAASLLQYARQLLIMDLAAQLRLYVINFDRPPVAIQLGPRLLARAAASVGGRLAVALDVSREAGVTTFDVTCYDVVTAKTVCRARESTTAGPEFVPALTGIVAAGAAQGFDVRAVRPTVVETRRERSAFDDLPPRTFRLGARGLVIVPVVMVRRQTEPLGGGSRLPSPSIWGASFIDLLGDFAGERGPLHAERRRGILLAAIGRQRTRRSWAAVRVHYVSQNSAGPAPPVGNSRPDGQYTLWRDQPVQVRVDLSYFIDLFGEPTVDRLIKGYDTTIVSHGPMLSVGAAF